MLAAPVALCLFLTTLVLALLTRAAPQMNIYSVGFPVGSARNAFAALTSLLPGTVPSGDEGSRLVYHCLDVDQPVVSQLAAEEAALRHAIRHD